MGRLALFSIQQTDLTSFSEGRRGVKWLCNKPYPYPNRNPNSNPNRISKKKNDFRKSIGQFAGWKKVLTTWESIKYEDFGHIHSTVIVYRTCMCQQQMGSMLSPLPPQPPSRNKSVSSGQNLFVNGP
jgi:hypothetical protein